MIRYCVPLTTIRTSKFKFNGINIRIFWNDIHTSIFSATNINEESYYKNSSIIKKLINSPSPEFQYKVHSIQKQGGGVYLDPSINIVSRKNFCNNDDVYNAAIEYKFVRMATTAEVIWYNYGPNYAASLIPNNTIVEVFINDKTNDIVFYDPEGDIAISNMHTWVASIDVVDAINLVKIKDKKAQIAYINHVLNRR